MLESCADQSNVPDDDLSRSVELARCKLRENSDQKVFWLLVGQWLLAVVGGVALAMQSTDFHLETLTCLVVGAGILTVLPLWLLLHVPGTWKSRWSIVVTQGCMSALFWYVSGGRTETQVHLFAWIVVLGWYRDISSMVAVSAIALGGDLIVRAIGYLPESTIEDQWTSQFVCLVGLFAETMILSAFVLFERRSTRERLQRDADATRLQSELHRNYENRTRELIAECDQLRKELAIAGERRATLEAAHVEGIRELSLVRRELAERGATIVSHSNRQAGSASPTNWRDDWQSIRKEARQLMRAADLRSLLPNADATGSSADGSLSESKYQPSNQGIADRRALLMMRNPLHLGAVTKALNTAGYTVDTVATGPNAYYSIVLHDFELILVDVDLPGEEGYDVLEAIRLLPVGRVRESNCVFALTTKMTPDQILRCTNVGVDGILLKPLMADALRDATSKSPSRNSSDIPDPSWCWNGAGLARYATAGS